MPDTQTVPAHVPWISLVRCRKSNCGNEGQCWRPGRDISTAFNCPSCGTYGQHFMGTLRDAPPDNNTQQ